MLPSRRDVLRYGGAFGAAASVGALAACNNSNSGTDAGGDGTPQSGGTVVIAQEQPVAPVAPLNQAIHNQVWRRGVFDTLLDYSPDGPTLQPCLAEEWSESEDGTVVTFSLREGVQWHSGRDFEAADVQFSIERATDTSPSFNLAWVFDGLQDVVIDGLQITLTFDRPVSALYDALTLLPIIDRESYEGFVDGTAMIGTGPFTWESFNPNSELILARNENYWQENRPFLDRVEIRFITRSEALVSAVRAGDVDMGMNLLALDRQSLEGDERFEVEPYATYGAGLCIGANVDVEPLNNKDVRQAVNYAIDRQRINDELYLGQGRVSAAPWSPVSPVYEEAAASAYARDLEAARELLAGSGAEGSTIVIQGGAPVSKACEVVAFNLGEIGLDTEVEIFAPGEEGDFFSQRSYTGLRLGFHGWNTLTPITAIRSAAPYRVENNLFNFASDEYAELAENLAGAASSDVAEASAAVTDYLLDEAFCLDIVHTTNNAVSQGEVRDWSYNSWDEILWTDAWKG